MSGSSSFSGNIWNLIFDIWEKAMKLVLKNDDDHAEGGNYIASRSWSEPYMTEMYFNELTYFW